MGETITHISGDGPELQLDALHYAAQDMDTYATSAYKYIVLLTDSRYHEEYNGNRGDGLSEYTKQHIINELTATGCPVYISLWDAFTNYVPLHYYLQNEWYNDLNVNDGEFDPSKDAESNPTQPLYPLANLRARVLTDLGVD